MNKMPKIGQVVDSLGDGWVRVDHVDTDRGCFSGTTIDHGVPTGWKSLDKARPVPDGKIRAKVKELQRSLALLQGTR